MITRKLWVLSAVVAPLLVSAGTARAGDPPWTPLFDGKTLAGWVKRGGNAQYEVKDGAIVGTSVPSTPNSFLCTDRSYGDFVLEYEFQVDEALNSGVQLRSQSHAGYQNGRVHGIQVEIDPDVKRNRMWTGGLYEEGRRGWLNDLTKNEPARKAFKPGAWNAIRVEAFGDRIRTFLNGVPAGDVVDSVDLEGFIALQVHGVKGRSEPLHVGWRNLRIKDWGRRRWVKLLDGKSTPRAAGGGSFGLKDGVLVGTIGKAERRHGLAFFPTPAGDFTARLEYRVSGGNAGLYFRAQPAGTPAGARGLQVDIDPRGGTGGLYETGGRGWIARAEPQKGVKALPRQAGDFDVLTVSARGGRVVTHVNGVRMAVIEDAPTAAGLLALELNAGEDVRLEVRRLELLSDAIPPPVPGLAIGYCSGIKGVGLEDAKAAGFEFLEIGLRDVVGLSDEEFEKLAARVQGLGVPVISAINFIPPELKLVGPQVDVAKQNEYVARALARAGRLGLKMVVLGSGAARTAPDGFAPAQAEKQLVDFGRRVAKEAKKHQITVVVEALRKAETNMINTAAEALALVKAVGHPNFQMLVDHYHMSLSNEDPAIILQAAKHIRHVQIANPAGRALPFADYESDYALFFRYLADIGYRGGISIEGRAPAGVAADGPRAIGFLRRMVTDVAEAPAPPPRRPARPAAGKPGA